VNWDDKKPGDAVFEVSINELLRTCGISLAKWSNDITYTDAPYSEGWIEEVGEQMATLSFLCHHFIHLYPSVPRDVAIDLPPYITGQTRANPLRATSMDESPADGEASSHESDDLFPF